MCTAVFIASDVPLPTIDWDKNAPAFNVSTLQEFDEPVRQHFTKPHIYYVGAHEGCGCGFSYGALRGFDPPDPEEEERESVRRLREYLAAAVEFGPVELYAVYCDKVRTAPESRRVVTPAYFGGDVEFYLNEGEFFVVKKE